MEKKSLVRLIDEIFIPLGFKKRGYAWIYNEKDLSKTMELERSGGNSFHINFGYIIKGLELTSNHHVSNRLSGKDRDEQLLINQLLNLDSPVKPAERLAELKRLIDMQVVGQFNAIHSQNDLYNELNSRTHLNNVPMIVQEYFNFR